LIFSGDGGPAGGTNYLMTATNLALPIAQWTSIATNPFDDSGQFAITNTLPSVAPRQFFRLRLQ
jgi:hypothetical protein